MVVNIDARGDEWVLFDNQQLTTTYPCDIPQTTNQWAYFDATWNWRTFFYPVSVVVDLGYPQTLTQLCLDDASDPGGICEVFDGGTDPTTWSSLFQHDNVVNDCHSVNITTQFLKFTFNGTIARIREVEIYGTAPNTISCPPPISACDPLTNCNCARPTMEDFMGSNFNIDVPPVKANALGFVRCYQHEYFNWGYATEGHPSYPNDQYEFGPTHVPMYDHDFLYQGLQDLGIGVNAAMHHQMPTMATFAYHNNDPSFTAATAVNQGLIDPFKLLHVVHRKPFDESIYPIVPDMVVDMPEAYIEYADMMYQFSARYGFPGTTNNLKVAPTNVARSGLGQVQYVENWNEPDKWWHYFLVDGLPFLDPAIEEELAYFSPYEFAAKSSAEIDGHGETNGVENIVTARFPNGVPQGASPLGLENSNGNMKFVMGGISEININWVRAMKFWFEHHRPDIGFPFDVINFHDYSNDGADGAPLGTHALSPEEDNIREKMAEVVDYRNRYLPGVEVWQSEFGYDTNPNSPQSADPSLYCSNPNDAACMAKFREIQAQWNVRGFLELAAAGVDRAMVFNMRDDSPETSWGLYETSGLCTFAGDDYQPKQAWFYIASMKNTLTGLTYDPTYVHADPAVRVYKFVDNCNAPTKEVYAVWSPTAINGDDSPVVSNYALPIASNATQIKLTHQDMDGVRTVLTPIGGSIQVEVSERPKFIVVGEMAEDMAGCNCNYLPFQTSGNGNVAMLNNEQSAIGEPFCGTGDSMLFAWTPAIGEEAIIDLNSVHNVENLFLHTSDGAGSRILEISIGAPGNWQVFNNWSTNNPMNYKWKTFSNINLTTRYLRLKAMDSGIRIDEIAICGYSACSSGGGSDVNTFLNLTTCDSSMAGTVVDTYPAFNGCDSIVTTTTTLFPSDAISIFESSCNPVDTGTIIVVLGNQFGCDSTITTITSFLPSDNIFINSNTCDANQSGTFVVNLINQYGCDSIVTNVVQLNPSDSTYLNGSSCNPADVGSFTNLYTNQFGCDSLVVETISFDQNSGSTQNLVLCEGQSVTVGTNTYVSSGNYLDTLFSITNNCDSIVTTNLQVNPTDDIYIIATSCDPNEVSINIETYQNQYGCDSTITYEVEFLALGDTTYLDFEICDGEFITVAGNNYNTTGVFIDALTNQVGCDSVLFTFLNVEPNSFNSSEMNIVQGELFNGIPILNDTSIIQLFPAINGCDSFHTTNLMVIPNSVLDFGNHQIEMNLFPNPATEAFNIQLLTNRQEVVSIEMLDLTGRVVTSFEKVELKNGVHVTLEVSVTDFPAGTYFIKLNNEQNLLIDKLVLLK